MNDKNITSSTRVAAFVIAISVPLPLSASITTHNAANEQAYRFTAPLGMAGSGCKAEEVPLDSDPFVEFRAYQANGERRVGCSLAIPLQVAAGYQVAVKTVRYSGKTRGKGMFKYKVFFAGMPNREFVERIPEALHGREYFHEDKIGEPLWSVCGRSVNLRFNTSLRAKGKADKISLTTLSFELMQRACE